jgi:hypothetical protein
LSFNPFAWSEQIDPRAGVLRLVFGLGSRAVRRSDDDYTRIVALNAPSRRPETTSGEVRGYAQWRVDVLDLERKQHCVRSFEEVVESCGEQAIEMVASRDPELIRESRGNRRAVFAWVLTFKKLLSETSFVGDMRELLGTLEKAYDYPVDIEFTTNFLPDGGYRINLVQCRPFQVKGGGPVSPPPENVAPGDLVLATKGAIIGPSLTTEVGRLIYVVPGIYGQLSLTDRYSVARLIGRLTRLDRQPEGALLLAGPGRWGTAEPTLGVPVSFAEISRVTALCEIIEMRDGLVPDVSLGTHFFNDLVETQVLYLALVPGKQGNIVNANLIEHAVDQLPALIPIDEPWGRAVRVIEPASLPGPRVLHLHADAVRQSAVCYFDPGER